MNMDRLREIFSFVLTPKNPPMSLQEKSTRRIVFELLAVSFIVLFQELTLIRWIGGQIRVLAYFPNLILISAFLGLGLGCLRAGRLSLLWTWPLSLLLLVCTVAVMGRIVFTQVSTAEHLWLLYYDLSPDSLVIRDIRSPIVLSFLLSAVSFVPLGQLVADRIQEFRVRSSSLWGYSWDILGSLCGVVGFFIISFSGTFPVFWFSSFLIVGFVFFGPQRRGRFLYAIMSVFLLMVVVRAERATAYSPYYALSLDHRPDSENFYVLANGAVHQYAMDLQRDHPPKSDFQKKAREGYHFPYKLLGRPPQRALVLGAGTGNDVAVLLDQGAHQIDAVEIDPVIVTWGREFHPNKPFDSPKVRVFNTDARSFLNGTENLYDIIVFGTLDSMTRLSAHSNVRLDNFVYTLESIQAARRRLAPDGALILYFMVATDYIDFRLMGLLTKAFGKLPLVHDRHHGLFNRIYMAGPGFEALRDDRFSSAKEEIKDQLLEQVEIPHDDWPYLYLKDRGMSGFYLFMIIVIGVLSAVCVFWASGEMRAGLFQRGRVDGEMFLFGLAFLLLETRSVTEMSLVWGATWITSSVVFGSILTMVLLATVTTQLRPLPLATSAAGLVLALLVAYIFPVDWILGLHLPQKLILSLFVVGTPIYFASVCFALFFRDREAASQAFGWNILGAVAGGLLEFLSMSIGFKSLLLVALTAYLTAFLIHLRRPKTPIVL